MSDAPYKPKRAGLSTPRPTSCEWFRMLRKVKRAATGFNSPCWIWCGRTDADGYGEVKYRGAKRFAHRVAYAWKHGHTPANKDGEHLCKQRACINPAHLTILPPLVNAGGRSDADEAPEQVNKHNVSQYAFTRADGVPF